MSRRNSLLGGDETLAHLPRETVVALCLEVFKARLDGALVSLIWRVATLPVVGGLGLDDL